MFSLLLHCNKESRILLKSPDVSLSTHLVNSFLHNFKNTSLIALFSPLSEDKDDDDEMPDDRDSSDKPNQLDKDGPYLPSQDDPNGPDGDGEDGEGGRHFNASNMVIDGGTYAGDLIGSALGDAANASSGISGSAAGIISDYFSGIIVA